MSVVALTDITSALATLFQDRIVSQFNRSVVLSQLLPFQPGFSQNINWDVELNDGLVAQASSVLGDGTDVTVYNNDTILAATLSFAVYSEAFGVTGKALSAARATGNPAELANLFAEKIDRAVTRLAKNINKEIYTGSTSGGIVGLTGTNSGLEATGTYAGIDKGAHTDFAGNKLSNGGVNRALTLVEMRDMRRTIYNACGEMPDLIVCDAQQHENYGNLLATNRRYQQEVYLRGQKITLDGGYRALDFDGIPVIADVNCPANMMLFLNTNYIKLRQLPDGVAAAGMPGGDSQVGMVRLHGTAEEQLGQTMTSLTARINPLARTGDAFKFQLVLYPQLQVTRPNASGILADLV